MDLDLLEQTALEAAHAAGQLVRRGLAADVADLGVEQKGPVDIVTAVDKAAEAAIVAILRQRTPHIGILAEEGGFSAGDDADLMWAIDPLDGTTNFAHGHPQCAVSVACLERGRPVVGVVLDAGRGELFCAVRGRGAWLNDELLAVSQQPDLGGSLLVTGFPYDRRERAHRYLPLLDAFMRVSQGVRVMGAAALDLAWLAAGRFDGYWEVQLNPWDVAAGVLLVEEAGGRVTDYAGEALDVCAPRALLATNGRIHIDMVHVLGDHGALWQQQQQ